ncbi:MAG: hypothetical protein P8R42_00700 [Candidatus Binatia bacterium]|nr:hypothetical protein [Candidatus Binatia bacterium]
MRFRCPRSGAFSSVKGTLETVFDWQYELRQKNLLALYEKGKALTWNASDEDWSTEVNLEKLMQGRLNGGLAKMTNELMKPPVELEDDKLLEMQLHINAFLLSQFLHGEREDFIIEATELLRERLLVTPVFERLGWDADVWSKSPRRRPRTSWSSSSCSLCRPRPRRKKHYPHRRDQRSYRPSISAS